jgi:hypothetical protein
MNKLAPDLTMPSTASSFLDCFKTTADAGFRGVEVFLAANLIPLKLQNGWGARILRFSDARSK